MQDSIIPTLLEGLNEPQRRAVTAPDGPVLVVAGAGSGKTRVLTRRLAYLLATGRARPDEVMAVTFTNKAAAEMAERVERLLAQLGVPVSLDSLWIGTFHSISSRILRVVDAHYNGNVHHPFVMSKAGRALVSWLSAHPLDRLHRSRVPHSFTIYDADDQKALVKRILKEMNLEHDSRHVRKAIHHMERHRDGSMGSLSHPYDAVLRAYTKVVAESGAVDFTGLIELAILFAPAVAGKWKYLLIDEFQDTNQLQFRLIKGLASPHGNVFAVGDDDQSIYGWRGATPDFLIQFEHHFPGALEIRLEQNYRSTSSIIEAAAELISNNASRRPKRIWTSAPRGEPVYFRAFDDERSEARWIVSTMLERNAAGVSLDEMAVLYRTNAQSRPFEEFLRREGIPYAIVGGIKFYERAEIKDLVAYLRLAINPRSDVDIRRVINTPRRGIGDKALKRIEELSGGKSLWEGLLAARNERRIGEAVGRFVDLVTEAGRIASTAHPGDVLEFVLQETDWLGLQGAEDTESLARVENMNELLAAIKDYSDDMVMRGEKSTLEGFLESVALLSAEDGTAQGDGEKVWLMTVHAAKGLEFDVVFLPGWEDGLFPLRREDIEDEEAQLEEERRLAYVAMTRARRVLYITRARHRMLYGKMLRTRPSPFLYEIGQDRLRILGRTEHRGSAAQPSRRQDRAPKRSTDGKGRGGTDRGAPFVPGETVRHAKFGVGTVVGVEGTGPRARVSIRFASGAFKMIVASYLEKVS